MTLQSNKDLNKLQQAITFIVSIFLLLSIVVSTIFYIFILHIDKSQNLILYKERVKNANQILQANLAAQISIIANDTDFITYLRSGEITRKKYYTHIRWLFANLDHSIISGITIEKEGAAIFAYGSQTNLYTNIDLCYLNDKINPILGQCNNSMHIYFDTTKYIHKLHNLEPVITANLDNKDAYLFSPFNYKFGNFTSSTHSTIKLAFNVEHHYNNLLLISIILTLIIFIIIFLISYKYLNYLITSNLVIPLKNIIHALRNNNPLSTNNSNLIELNELIHVVNQYNNHQLEIKLDRIAASVAHDLNEPITQLKSLIPKIVAKQDKTNEFILLEDYISKIGLIASDVLLYFRESSSEDNIVNVNEHKFIILEEAIDNIIQNKELFNHFIIFNKTTLSWLYTSPIKLYRNLTNLLNNAIESLHKANKTIKITIETISSEVLLTIEDTGCGIPNNLIQEIRQGHSLKHKGKGLGLSSAIDYFNSLNGTLEVDSSLNIGTKITITIPQTIPKWITNNIAYNDNHEFITISHNPNIIFHIQKLLLNIENKKLYFTNAKAFINQPKMDHANSLILLIDFNQYKEMLQNAFSLISSNISIFIITDTNTINLMQNEYDNFDYGLIPTIALINNFINLQKIKD